MSEQLASRAVRERLANSKKILKANLTASKLVRPPERLVGEWNGAGFEMPMHQL